MANESFQITPHDFLKIRERKKERLIIHHDCILMGLADPRKETS